MYLESLKILTKLGESKENIFSWKTLREGYHYLRCAHEIVQDYESSKLHLAVNKSVREIDNALKELGFVLNTIHIKETDTEFDVHFENNFSNGQTPKFFKLLNSDKKKDVESFVEIVENKIENSIATCLIDINQDMIPTLYEAIKKGNVSDIENYTDSEIVNTKDSTDGMTPLHYAAGCGSPDIVKILLNKGADIEKVSSKGNTALHLAASKGRSEIVKILLEKANPEELVNFVNVQTISGRMTALHVAAEKGFTDIVKILLKYGANYDLINKSGKKPIDLATNVNVIAILKLIEDLLKMPNGKKKEKKLKNLKPDDFEIVSKFLNDRDSRETKFPSVSADK